MLQAERTLHGERSEQGDAAAHEDAEIMPTDASIEPDAVVVIPGDPYSTEGASHRSGCRRRAGRGRDGAGRLSRCGSCLLIDSPASDDGTSSVSSCSSDLDLLAAAFEQSSSSS